METSEQDFWQWLALFQEESFTLIASQEEAYIFTIAISTGTKSFEEIVEWLKIARKQPNKVNIY